MFYIDIEKFIIIVHIVLIFLNLSKMLRTVFFRAL